MSSRSTVAILLASTALLGLTGCTGGSSSEPESPAVTAPQADISGEWVVTRTVLTSDDASNPARAVGATSVRYVAIDREDCDEAVCPGTVLSGATLEGRTETKLEQTDGGLEYSFDGTLDCMNATTGGVLSVGAFEFSQTATLTVGESAEVDGVDTASTLAGTLTYTDTLTDSGIDAGCLRDPRTVTVEYSVAAVRAPAA